MGDDLARRADGDVAAGDVLAEPGPRQPHADRLAQAEVHQREVGIPVLDRQPR